MPVRLKTFASAVLLLLLGAFITSARADLKFGYELDPKTGLRLITVEGMFGQNDKLDEFERLVRRHQPHVVGFDSHGGTVLKAMELGRLIRRYNLDTVQPADAACESSCVFAFLGGVQRIAGRGALLGVHRWGYPKDKQISAADAMALAQDVTAETMFYVQEMGVDVGLIRLAMQIDNSDMRYLTGREAVTYRVITPPANPYVPTTGPLTPPAPAAAPAPAAPVVATAPAPTLRPEWTALPDTIRWVQIKSFATLPEVHEYARFSPMKLVAFSTTSGWYAVALKSPVQAENAEFHIRVWKEQSKIPQDSFATPGSTYLKKVCCD